MVSNPIEALTSPLRRLTGFWSGDPVSGFKAFCARHMAFGARPRDNAWRKQAREVDNVSDLARVLPWSQDEAELVTELQGGSGAAFDWLVTHYSGPVYGLVAGMVSETCDAADITQDVFLKAFRGIRGFRRGSSLKTWLYRIAIREALNHRRWLWRHHREQDSIDVEAVNGHASLEIEDESSTPFDQAASHEVQQAVQQALLKVPEVFRSAVILRDLEGMSYEEVAEVLTVTVGTVKSRILRGRRMLREILDPLLRGPHSPHAPGPAPVKRESVLHSTLFSAAEEEVESSRTDTTGWAHPVKTGDAEGGV
jgi:RNA polymerase sigma-70 factor (ECF subfamily)